MGSSQRPLDPNGMTRTPTHAPKESNRLAWLQVAVGFGVSKPEHAKQILDWGAEGVICGSALVKLLAGSGTPVGVRGARAGRGLRRNCASRRGCAVVHLQQRAGVCARSGQAWA